MVLFLSLSLFTQNFDFAQSCFWWFYAYDFPIFLKKYMTKNLFYDIVPFGDDFMIYVVILFFIILIIVLEKLIDYKNPNITASKNNVEFNNFIKKDYIMTKTELLFYRELKKITDKLDLSIFPQVDLERIINVKDNNNTDRNRIKSRTIDFTIVNNINCKIICCIELDDYTHNYKNRIQRDNFINELFSSVDIKLYRIKVGNYNMEEIQKKIEESL